MTRFLLASLGFAVLQLGAPHGASAPAAGLAPAGEPHRAAPSFDVASKGSFTREGTRTEDLRSAGGTAGAAVPLPLRHLPPDLREPGADDSRRPAPASASSLLPRPRAPPA